MNEEATEFELKSLSEGGVEAALRKAERYRLLNERREAESICRDVLAIDGTNQKALIIQILALSDLFRDGLGPRVEEARGLVDRLDGEYERAYYAGILSERWAKAVMNRDSPGSGAVAYGALREAMDWYEKAEELRPAKNDDPILRWNTCARLIMDHNELHPAPEDDFHPLLE